MVKRKSLTCPICASKLVLKQINLEEAVYLCKDNACEYPAGHSWLVVSRSFDEFTKELKSRMEKRDKAELKFLDQICTNDSIDTTDIMQELNNIAPHAENESFNLDNLIDNELLQLTEEADERSFNFIEFENLSDIETNHTDCEANKEDKVVILENYIFSTT